MAFGRAAAALGLAAALVIGVPLLLITVVGNPLPSELPSLNEIRILLTQNGQGFTHFLISTLSML
ncbi:MAG: ABC-type amino acid transport system permease subunit, partial [Acidimicrobiales bacterium]